MRLLILGGTADAKKMAEIIDKNNDNIYVIYSVAGLVRYPELNCDVISGGFQAFGGLTKYLQDNKITAILDATHPYAKTISTTALQAAIDIDIPYWRFQRPKWQQRSGDQWFRFSQWDELLSKLTSYNTIFFTVGQIPESVLTLFSKNCAGNILIRTAVEPNYRLPESCEWIHMIGPFNIDDEINLMREHNVTALVSKNSGGTATMAKIDAARQLQLPVFLLDRPVLDAANKQFSDQKKCVDYIAKQNF